MINPQKYESVVVGAFERTYSAVQAWLISRLKDLKTKDGIIQSDAHNLHIIDGLYNQILSQMDALGYSSAVRTQVDTLRNIHEDIKRELGEGIQGIEFQRANAIATDMLIRGADTDLVAAEMRCVSDIATILRTSAMGGVDFRDLVDTIVTKLGTHKHIAHVIATTAIHSFASKQITDHAKEAGYDTFAYLGPRDRATRPWCSHWVGRSGSMEEFEETGNEWGGDSHPKPVAVWRGGWQCRHRFIPIASDRQKERYPRGPRDPDVYRADPTGD